MHRPSLYQRRFVHYEVLSKRYLYVNGPVFENLYSVENPCVLLIHIQNMSNLCSVLTDQTRDFISGTMKRVVGRDRGKMYTVHGNQIFRLQVAWLSELSTTT